MKTVKKTNPLKIIPIYLQTFVTETHLAKRQTHARWRTSKVEKSVIDLEEARKLTVPIKMDEQLPLSLKTLTRNKAPWNIKDINNDKECFIFYCSLLLLFFKNSLKLSVT
jgi:hypothetical protein